MLFLSDYQIDLLTAASLGLMAPHAQALLGMEAAI
jgi:hypothetical protein